ncbi:hypothetical protein [Roseovarius salinarum]|uniref:hypothetical protein n=1 Tax=Roseovarius salinarum TaxID=1981892 RepID=UPI000C31CDC6|nr:hypothetical protein [Roseovarius salinarum]
MLDIMPDPALSRGAKLPIASTGKAELFVNGEHTAADRETRQIVLQLLKEIGTLPDGVTIPATQDEELKVSKTKAENIEKQVCFMASFLRAATSVEAVSQRLV